MATIDPTRLSASRVRNFGARGAEAPGMLLDTDCRTDAEIRALTVRSYILAGLKPKRVARILGISRSQVYVDLGLGA